MDEVQCSPFNWEFFHQEEGMVTEAELKHSLLYTTLELETTILSAKERISKSEDELLHLKNLLTKALQQRDEAEAKCQSLILDNSILQQELQKNNEESFVPKIEENDCNNKQFSTTSDSDDTNFIASSPNADLIFSSPPKLVPQKPLPEKGKLLQAVMEAGPLLQNLLLAGPLPQWQHPPPQLNPIEIPPVVISPPATRIFSSQDSCISSSSNLMSNKRSHDLVCSGGSNGSDSSPNTKYQKVVHLH